MKRALWGWNVILAVSAMAGPAMAGGYLIRPLHYDKPFNLTEVRDSGDTECSISSDDKPDSLQLYGEPEGAIYIGDCPDNMSASECSAACKQAVAGQRPGYGYHRTGSKFRTRYKNNTVTDQCGRICTETVPVDAEYFSCYAVPPEPTTSCTKPCRPCGR